MPATRDFGFSVDWCDSGRRSSGGPASRTPAGGEVLCELFDGVAGKLVGQEIIWAPLPP